MRLSGCIMLFLTRFSLLFTLFSVFYYMPGCWTMNSFDIYDKNSSNGSDNSQSHMSDELTAPQPADSLLKLPNYTENLSVDRIKQLNMTAILNKMKANAKENFNKMVQIQEKEIVKVYNENVMLNKVMENANKTKCILKSSDDYLWWVFNNGTLRVKEYDDFNTTRSWDLSYHFTNDRDVTESLHIFDKYKMNILTLSLAYNQLSSIPAEVLERFNETLERLSLTGNSFHNFHRTSDKHPCKCFPVMLNLLELDLRNCKIQYLHSSLFEGIVNLERLFLSYNLIRVLAYASFKDLVQLRHLDVSYNYHLPLQFKKMMEDPFSLLTTGLELERHFFDPMINLRYLDLSTTKIHFKSFNEFKYFNNSIEYMSLCYTGIPTLTDNMFERSKLKILDLSNNPSLALNLNNNSLIFLNDTLEILYLKNSNIKKIDFLQPLTKLQIINLSENNINVLKNSTFLKLTQLKAIDLSQNLINNWYNRIFTETHHLKILDLRYNIINILPKDMLEDLSRIGYVALGNNNFECSCKLKDIFDLFAKENIKDTRFDSLALHLHNNGELAFLWDETDYYGKNKDANTSTHSNKTQQKPLKPVITLFDYTDGDYFCINSTIKMNVTIDKLDDCNRLKNGNITDENKDNNDDKNNIKVYDDSGMTNVYLIIFFSFLPFLFIAIFLYKKWWYIRYFCILIKNSTILSFFNNVEMDKIIKSYPQGEFAYDVFVSYSEQNRNWVLDEFIPNIEKREQINICLHERDFIVGYTILTNIIDSIDKSRCLLLVVSKSFVSSHWCKFEMHLAQHRLMETRRDELILVLLEDVPEKNRPKELNFLMKTKTYLKWPTDDDGRKLFWKRLKKAIKVKNNEWEET